MFKTLLFNRVVSQFTLYSFALYSSSLVNFLLLPFIIRFLSPYEFGIFENFIVTVTILSKLLLFGQDILVLKNSFLTLIEKRSSFWSSSFVLITCVFLIIFFFVIIDLLTYQFLSFILKLDTSLLMWAVVISYCYAIFQLHSAILKSEVDTKQHLILHLIRILCDAFLIIFVILFFSLSLVERTATYVLSFLLTFVFSIWYFQKRGLSFSFEKQFVSFKTSLYFMGIAFFELGIQFIDRIMISNILTLSDSGIYSFGYRFSTILLIVCHVIHAMWMPFYLENKGSTLRVFKYIILVHVGMFFLITSYIFLMWLLFPYLVPDQYLTSFLPFTIVTCAYFFDLTWRLMTWVLFCKKREATVFVIYSISFIMNIGLNYFLIQSYGITGAAISTAISLLLGAFISLGVIFLILDQKNPQI